MKKSIFFVSLIISFLSSLMAFADDYPYIYKGFRPMGMGGAFVAVSDDANALFYNPAGLSDVKEKKASILSIEVELSRNGFQAFKDGFDLDTENPVETASFLRDYIGDYNHASISTFPNLVEPNFAFGFFGSIKEDFIAHNYQFPKLDMSHIEDAGIAVGGSRSFYDDNLSLGVSGKLAMRRSLEKEYTLPEIAQDDFQGLMNDDMEDGYGVLLDIGGIYRLGEITSSDGRKINAQAGMSVNNLIGSSMGSAEDLPVHVDVGIALKSDPVILAFDCVDIFRNFDQDEDISKRLRLGIEYAYNKLLAFRAGAYQGYPSYGISLTGEKAQFDLLSYAEEVGTYSGQTKNRRYAFRFAFGF